jgi:hypothetical protein
MECISSLPYSINSCSGNGYICQVPDIGCICNSGWTSLGDFSLGISGSECQINYLGVRIISYFCIFFSAIFNILIIWHYVQLAKKLRSYYVISREFKTLFPFCFLITGISATIFGILKVTYPDGKQPLLGRDVSISFVIFINMSSCFIGLVLYLHVIIQFLKGYSRMMSLESRERVSMRFQSLGFYSWFLPPFTLIFALMPLISTAYPSQSIQLGMTHLIGLFWLFIVGLFSYICIIYYLHVDSLTYALAGLHFCEGFDYMTLLVVTFFK